MARSVSVRVPIWLSGREGESLEDRLHLRGGGTGDLTQAREGALPHRSTGFFWH